MAVEDNHAAAVVAGAAAEDEIAGTADRAVDGDIRRGVRQIDIRARADATDAGRAIHAVSRVVEVRRSAAGDGNVVPTLMFWPLAAETSQFAVVAEIDVGHLEQIRSIDGVPVR